MLTQEQIGAENFTTALSPVQKENLLLLVRGAYPTYASAWDTALTSYIDEEIAAPTVKTQVLKAVLTSLSILPPQDVESQGDVNSPTFYSSQANWRSLALDVFNVFRITIAQAGHQSMGVVTSKIEDLILDDPNWLNQPTPYLK